MKQLLLLLAAASSAANVNQLPPKISYLYQEDTTAPWEYPNTERPKDCNEVCRDITGPEFIPDFCCSRHYCECENGLGWGGSCPEEEGFCQWSCSEGGCNPQTCCADTTTAEAATTEPAPKISYLYQEETTAPWEDYTTPQPKDCNEVCKDSIDQELIADSCCSRHYCACEHNAGADRHCENGQGFSTCEKKCKAECNDPADCVECFQVLLSE